MIPMNADPCPGGWMVTVEVPNAYTDGSSRFDRVFVAAAEMTGDEDARMDAIVTAYERAPLSGLSGVDGREWKRLRAGGVAKPIEAARQAAKIARGGR